MSLTTTTLTRAIGPSDLTFAVGSLAAFPPIGTRTAQQQIRIDDELMVVVAVPAAKTVQVRMRGADGTAAVSHAAGAVVSTSANPQDFAAAAQAVAISSPPSVTAGHLATFADDSGKVLEDGGPAASLPVSTGANKVLFDDGTTQAWSEQPQITKLLVLNAAGDGDNYLEGHQPALNNGAPFGVPVTLSATVSCHDSDHGGMDLTGWTDGQASAITFFGISNGSLTPSDNSRAVFHFVAHDFSDTPFTGQVFFGISNDYSENGPIKKWMVQLVEGHGTNISGFPDTVPLFGIGTDAETLPSANLHVRNPPTHVSYDGSKNTPVTLIEGRADQVADLTQWKLTGGAVLAAITHTGGMKVTLPTADPHVAGVLWANSGIVTVSAG